ncbi:MAG: hypothetical protein H6677_06385 [Candidatus Obscuribacterales bacterium]|nr:hypothetical protein [Cyanobacteria bacterium HKST-UBA01]MCB9467889.1 hypothetical protein [Candidatus Obscuribacterales bacterium]HMO19519.1 hypothetical protein [Candidatus Melainabacteria bacterium]
MKRLMVLSLMAIASSVIALTACGGGDNKASVEVNDKLLGDGKEVNIETPAGNAHLDLPSADSN